MKILHLSLVDEFKDEDKAKISSLLDQEVEQFSKFMSSIGDWKTAGPLNEAERALIKTYLVQKLTGKVE